MPLLEVSQLEAGYGAAPIIKGVNMALEAGDIGVIIGPNGAGKSSCLKSIFGLLQVTGGTITFDGKPITHIAPEKLAACKVAFVPQEANIFPTLTVHENLEMGAFPRRDDIKPALDYVYSIFPPLTGKMNQPAGELSGGQRQMVAFARALMIEPRLLLLDEPTAGLSPLYMSEVFDRILAINETGVSILMVEQNAKQALAIADQAFVLVSGKNGRTGTGAELLADPEVAASFLGGADHE